MVNELAQVASGGGTGTTVVVGTALLIVLTWMWRLLILAGRDQKAAAERATNEIARTTIEINRINEAHAKELSRINKDHDDELIELRETRRRENEQLRTEVERLTGQVTQLNVRLDEEIKLRRAEQTAYFEQLRMLTNGPKN